MPSKNIAIIVNAHREGPIALPTLASIDRAIAVATRHGITTEVVLALDMTDDITRGIMNRWCETRPFARVEETTCDDLGLARNFGVGCTDAEWVSFLDADDLFAPNWLLRAFTEASNGTKNDVWHPEVNLYFGATTRVFVHLDMTEPHFDLAKLVSDNVWTALCFASRELLTEVPYRKADFSKQIAYEDWCWNLDTIARGAVHRVVIDTAHLIRTKPVSLVKRMASSRSLTYPPDLFRAQIGSRDKSAAKLAADAANRIYPSLLHNMS